MMIAGTTAQRVAPNGGNLLLLRFFKGVSPMGNPGHAITSSKVFRRVKCKLPPIMGHNQ
jgi:hypothetical protein